MVCEQGVAASRKQTGLPCSVFCSGNVPCKVTCCHCSYLTGQVGRYLLRAEARCRHVEVSSDLRTWTSHSASRQWIPRHNALTHPSHLRAIVQFSHKAGTAHSYFFCSHCLGNTSCMQSLGEKVGKRWGHRKGGK